MSHIFQTRTCIAFAGVMFGAFNSPQVFAQNSATSCFVSGQWISCDTTTTPSAPQGPTDYLGPMHVLPDPAGAFQEGQQQALRLRQQQALLEQQRLQNQQAAQNLAEQRRLSEERSAQQRADAVRVAGEIRSQAEKYDTWKKVIDLVMTGRCPDAINTALVAQDLELATKIKVFCNSGNAPKPLH